ncbi:MAG TPA: type II toxin-antitoxin system HicA family toxin [Thermoplasmata archaeon]|nr:type II toxin-antitoxin system HicA family toxin [Thermoplasmata archaeon]
MVVKKTRNIAAALTKKGFREEPRRKKHDFYYFYENGKKTRIWTKLSHGVSEYNDDLLTEMRKQLKFEKKKDLEKFIDCPFKKEDYLEMLREKSIRY